MLSPVRDKFGGMCRREGTGRHLWPSTTVVEMETKTDDQETNKTKQINKRALYGTKASRKRDRDAQSRTHTCLVLLASPRLALMSSEQSRRGREHRRFPPLHPLPPWKTVRNRCRLSYDPKNYPFNMFTWKIIRLICSSYFDWGLLGTTWTALPA